MSNVLKVSLQTTIYSLAKRGWSQRRIASELALDQLRCFSDLLPVAKGISNPPWIGIRAWLLRKSHTESGVREAFFGMWKRDKPNLTHCILEPVCTKTVLRPLFFLSRTTIDFWKANNVHFKSEEQLRRTLFKESDKLQDFLMNVFANVFPDEAAVFERATEFYQEKFDEVPLYTPTDVLFFFGSCLYWAKQELGYKDDPLTRIRRFRSFGSAGIPTYFVHFRPTGPC